MTDVINGFLLLQALLLLYVLIRLDKKKEEDRITPNLLLSINSFLITLSGKILFGYIFALQMLQIK